MTAITLRLGFLFAGLLTLVCAYLAVLCWGGVLDGTSAANSDGGLAVGFTFLAGLLGGMLWIGRGR